MSGERLALAGQQIIGKHLELAAGSDFRVKLSDSSRRCVARIGEARLVQLFAFSVDSLKHFSRNKCFAPYFKLSVVTLQI